MERPFLRDRGHGGIVPGDEAEIPRKIIEQAQIAIDHASLILLVVDGRTASQLRSGTCAVTTTDRQACFSHRAKD
jgi:hypothetical protein